MAETWRARLVGDAGVTKPVLIKKVLPEFAGDEAFISMFTSEARISATLSHGNVAQVFDFGRVDGDYFLAMEYVDGQPLHRVLKRALRGGMSALPIPLATYIALEMCRGLHYAHTRTDDKGQPLGIVHRDISPDNVLISYEGQVKIVDFGIAKARSLRNFDTEPGVVKGKYLFFSPEQARGRQVDARTDVWATGVVLYELLCGRLPVSGAQHLVMSRMATGEFPSPRQVREDLPEALEEIVMRALSVDLTTRFESSHAFGDALAGFLYGFAPRFSSMNLAYLVRELFRSELSQEGRELAVPAPFLEELELWRGSGRAAVATGPEQGVSPSAKGTPSEVASLPTRKPASRPSSREQESAPRRKRALLMGGGALALLLGAVGPWLVGSQTPETREMSPLSPVVLPEQTAQARPSTTGAAPAAPEASGDADAGPRAGPPSATAPVTSFYLDARRHVFLVPPERVAFGALDPQVGFSIHDATRGGVVTKATILEPGPRVTAPVFFLLSSDRLLATARRGALSLAPKRFRGASFIYLFSLGGPTPDNLPDRKVVLTNELTGQARQFTFQPESMGVPTDGAFLVDGLDSRSVYMLSLSPKGEGASLHGRGHEVETQVACVQWMPPGAGSPSSGAGPRYAEQPLQFLLGLGEEVRIRGVQGLWCGFIDDDPMDNQGGMQVWISRRGQPEDASPRSDLSAAQQVEAARLLLEVMRHVKSKRYQNAFLAAERCLEIAPAHPECLLYSGSTLARLNRIDEAARRYRRFLEVAPRHQNAERIREVLRSYDSQPK
jgi:serine/threonine-protein kinase